MKIYGRLFATATLVIIFGPDLSYEDTLVCAGLLSLEARRHLACKKFVTETLLVARFTA